MYPSEALRPMRPQSLPRKAPSALDCLIGGQLRKARELRRSSLAELAIAVGVSLQQLQKYETGENRITAARLHRVATALRIPVSFFFSTAPSDGSGIPSFSASTVVLENLTPTKARFIRTLMRLEDRALDQLSAVAYQVSKDGDGAHEGRTPEPQDNDQLPTRRGRRD